MKTKFAVVFAAFVLVFASCKKEKNDDPDNGGTTADYQPTTAGSTWQYNSTLQGAYTETAAGPERDTTIEGEKYTALDNSAGGTRYINKSNGVYKSYSYIQQINQALTLTYLKDAAAGTAWSEDEVYSNGVITVPIKFSYTIASRDGEKVVNNITYKDVIAVTINVSANSPLLGGNVTIATGRQFYAKGIGGIGGSFNFNALGNTASDSTYLVTHSIK